MSDPLLEANRRLPFAKRLECAMIDVGYWVGQVTNNPETKDGDIAFGQPQLVHVALSWTTDAPDAELQDDLHALLHALMERLEL